jgi:SOS-response transcriptional repressor LexA
MYFMLNVKAMDKAMDKESSKKAGPPVKATGFASPAQGYEEEPIDFNRELMANPAATFVMVCRDDSMASYGLPYGAQLVVDRSLKPQEGSLIVFAYEGRVWVRQMFKKGNDASGAFKTIFSDGLHEWELKSAEYEFFGVVRAGVTLFK